MDPWKSGGATERARPRRRYTRPGGVPRRRGAKTPVSAARGASDTSNFLPGGATARGRQDTAPPAARRCVAPVRTLKRAMSGDRLRRLLCDSDSRPTFRIARPFGYTGIGERPGRRIRCRARRAVWPASAIPGSLTGGPENDQDLRYDTFYLLRRFCARWNSGPPCEWGIFAIEPVSRPFGLRKKISRTPAV